MDIFSTMETQTRMAFGVSIKVEALFKNLQNKNRDFASQTFKVEEEAKKSKAEVNVLKKQ